MLTYKAMYKFADKGVHGEVLDFAGVITCGKTLNEIRKLLADALVDMAETNLMLREPLPFPNYALTYSESNLEEPVQVCVVFDEKTNNETLSKIIA